MLFFGKINNLNSVFYMVKNMKVYLITRNATWCEDCAMVVIAEDRLHAERRARWSSDDFKKEKNLKIKEINLGIEQEVLTCNVGG